MRPSTGIVNLANLKVMFIWLFIFFIYIFWLNLLQIIDFKGVSTPSISKSSTPITRIPPAPID